MEPDPGAADGEDRKEGLGLSSFFTLEFYVGLVAAGLIGVCLGLVGSGGSVLSVPLLVYCFHIDVSRATAYALFIVGVTSLIGALISVKRSEVDFKATILFSLPCVLSVYLTRRYLLPVIPDPVVAISGVTITKSVAIMILLFIFMMAAGIAMILHAGAADTHTKNGKGKAGSLLFTGFIVGPLTALVGMGGGFLIVSALVLFGKMPMKKAVGTSLTIIAIKSFAGVVGDVHAGQRFDIDVILWVTVLAISGMVIGSYARQYIALSKLKYSFGCLVIALALAVLVTEVSKVI